jgi:LDH2 family malate/lactate/ureidoglycolate dehydrogenase
MAYDISNNEPVTLYPEATLRDFSSTVLHALGASEEEANIVTDGIVTASLWYHPGQGQGLEKLFRYQRRLQGGGIIPQADMTWERQGPSFALLDAAKGFGYVASQRAMNKAVELAKQTGIAIVNVRNSNHFGIAGYHAVTAAKAGLIGWSMTNARSEMAPWGSAEPVLATNPWGMAVPTPLAHPIMLDMALTMSGKGMMRWYEHLGKPIPESWALTPDGRTTTNPSEAMDGPLLPIGEYKGYGMSLITDILTGVMSGAKFGLTVFRDETHYDVGHTMVAIQPEVFMDRAVFEQRLEQLINEVKSAKAIDPDKPVLLPGELEYQRSVTRRHEGIPIANETVAKLRVLADDIGVESPL